MAGCASTPLPALPESDVPVGWHAASVPVTGSKVQDEARWPDLAWWKDFHSSELSEVMQLLEQRNLDLQNNARNLAVAQIDLREAGFSLWPTPLVEIGTSKRYAGEKATGTAYTDGGVATSSISAGFTYADILSKPAQYDAAMTRYESSVAFAADTRLNTQSTAASTYFQILLLRDQIKTSEQNVDNAVSIVKIVQARVDAGTVNQIDLLQQKIALQRQRNNVQSLKQDEYAARAALALLLADSVQNLVVQADTLQDVVVPSVAPGLPSELLSRRPDLVQAEANLRVSRANVDLARASYLPNISLTGSASLLGSTLSKLLDGGAVAVAATGGITETLLDNGARGRDVERSKLAMENALANYRKLAIGAFNDIDTSLGNIELLKELGAVAVNDLARAEESFRIAEVRYREGVADYQTVLVSQNSLFDARMALLANKLARLNAVISFYQSLGGGWTAGNASGLNDSYSSESY